MRLFAFFSLPLVGRAGVGVAPIMKVKKEFFATTTV
jgi:hypothetical protein